MKREQTQIKFGEYPQNGEPIAWNHIENAVNDNRVYLAKDAVAVFSFTCIYKRLERQHF